MLYQFEISRIVSEQLLILSTKEVAIIDIMTLYRKSRNELSMTIHHYNTDTKSSIEHKLETTIDFDAKTKEKYESRFKKVLFKFNL